MDKLQHLLDTAFGQPAAERAPQQPSELTIQRQREFNERMKRIEMLRTARLARTTTRH
jgi:hypothetical protein